MEEIKLFNRINKNIYINHLFYFFRNLPIIKKRAGSIYEFSEESGYLALIFSFIPFIGTLIKYILFMAVVFITSSKKYIGLNESNSVIQSKLLLLFTILSLFESLELDNAKLFVQQMKFSYRNFAIARYLIAFKRNTIVKLIVLSIVGLIINVSVWKMILLALLSASLNIFSVIYNNRLENSKFASKNRTLYKVFELLFFIVIFVGIFVFTTFYNFNNILERSMNLFIVPLIVLLFYIGYRNLFNYKNYSLSVRHAIQTDYVQFKVNNPDTPVNVSLVGKSNLDKKYSSDKYSHLKGNKYLNRLFFERNVIQIRKHILIITGIFSVLTLFLLGVDFYTKENVIEDLFKQTSIWIMLALIGTNTRNVVKSMFYNCDRSLLKYAFYKNKRNILESFIERLKYISIINQIPIFIVFLLITIYTIIFHFPLLNQLVITYIFTFLLVFFVGTLELSLYYIIQPFTLDAKVKSPLYNLFALPVTIVMFSQKYIPNFTLKGTIITILLCIIVSISLIFAVYKVAPKTFRVR